MIHALPESSVPDLVKARSREVMNTTQIANKNAAVTTSTGSEERERFKTAFELCIKKTRKNIEDLAKAPKSWSFDTLGNYANWNEGFFAINNWTSSFMTGMALLAWQETEEEHFLKHTLSLQPLYHSKVFRHHEETMHDLGFLYSLYSVALYKLTGDKTHRDVGVRAAEILANRYIFPGKFIRAWGRMDSPKVGTVDDGDIHVANMAIIDCMMNLPLLFWAGRETGRQRYHDAAVNHADTTLKYFFRADDSVYHAYRFNLETGEPVGGDNYCGRDVETHWARGTAWGIYGFALCYSYTGDLRYRDASIRLAKKFISNLDQEMVPVWDFKLPPGEQRLRDSSAAAIAVCGFQELLKHRVSIPSLSTAKNTLLDRLCSKDYLDFNPGCHGILKNGQVGRAKNAYTSWGDYYLMESLATELRAVPTFW